MGKILSSALLTLLISTSLVWAQEEKLTDLEKKMLIEVADLKRLLEPNNLKGVPRQRIDQWRDELSQLQQEPLYQNGQRKISAYKVVLSDSFVRFIDQLKKEGVETPEARRILRQMGSFVRDLEKFGTKDLIEGPIINMESKRASSLRPRSYPATYASYQDPQTKEHVELRGIVTTKGKDELGRLRIEVRTPVLVPPEGISNFNIPGYFKKALKEAARRSIEPTTEMDIMRARGYLKNTKL